jgi:uncharacterized protein YbbC (DUF1343 family)
MKLGIDILSEKQFGILKNKRVGLLAHRASVDSRGDHALDLLAKTGVDIGALFGPEHGLETKAQDMEPVASRVDIETHIPVHSLYGDSFESLSPDPEMLEGIDVLLVDLQDVGSRYYTYVWTTALCMKACAKAGKPVLVCDRPNPLGGEVVEGPLPKERFLSFVGLYPLPIRHGMTIGEIARYVNEEYDIGCDLTVVSMEGWKRGTMWPDTGLEWINPSPNMRSFNAEILYPGMCLVEGTNMSEGRGTDTPFEIVGAPFIDSEELIETLNVLDLPGVRAAPTSFIPTMQKHTGSMCNGVRWIVNDVAAFKPYLNGLAFVWATHKLYKDMGFKWRTEPYEFVDDIPAIDLLTGSDEFRKRIDEDFAALVPLAAAPAEFMKTREKYLLY